MSVYTKWLVYYVSSEGFREGNEYIIAKSREEAIEHYKLYFNVASDCRAVPVFDRRKLND